MDQVVRRRIQSVKSHISCQSLRPRRRIFPFIILITKQSFHHPREVKENRERKFLSKLIVINTLCGLWVGSEEEQCIPERAKRQHEKGGVQQIMKGKKKLTQSRFVISRASRLCSIPATPPRFQGSKKNCLSKLRNIHPAQCLSGKL